MSQIYFRSFNPVWNFRDLTGLPLDSSYYAFFLENTIPYQYQPVYHTPSGTPWSNPIQLTAAGTLPVNVFFDPNLVYRIEIRAGNTQADALIWLIEDYTPDGGGDGPITTAGITSDNQMTNPQFSLISFEDEISLASVTNPPPIQIAPGWELVLIGTGNATITREPLNNITSNPTNAPYALGLNLLGWTTAYLRQRFNESGMLWANKFVSTSMTGRVEGANANISATMVDSNGTLLGTLLPNTTLLDSNYTQKTGVAFFGDSTNPDIPPAAWVEYRLNFLGSMHAFVTSFQVISSSTDIAFTYEQETIQRQIDHTFHYYRDSILFQPKDSVLTGWDFGLNPWQFWDTNGDDVATNEYTADQTIIIQQAYVANVSNTDNVNAQRASAANNYGFQVNALTATNKFAALQYVDPASIRPYWGYLFSALVKVSALLKSGGSVGIKMRLIYSTSLPATTAQNEPVASWSSSGEPVFTAQWTSLAPKNDPVYTISSGSHVLTFNSFELPASSSDNMTLAAVIYTMDNMDETGTPDYLILNSCSLTPNEFAIDCNALSFDDVLRKCQFYYEKSYALPDLAGAVTTNGELVFPMSHLSYTTNTGPVTYNWYSCAAPFSISLKSPKRTSSYTPVLYAPGTGAANQVTFRTYTPSASGGSNHVASTWTLVPGIQSVAATISASVNLASATGIITAAPAYSSSISLHYVVDCRLGI